MKTINKMIALFDSFYGKGKYRFKKTLKKYPDIDIVSLNDSYAGVIKLSKGIYGIGGVIVKEQKKGDGTKLVNKIHKKHKGIFLLRSSTSQGFWKKMGYKKVGDVFVYINKNIVDW